MYQALYRKWRPKSFDDVVSQPAVTKTLKNQIASGKTAHAYLFTGSRGTGKTTCARIFAKAINCLDPHDGEPCLECSVCKAAENGALSDIIEIDAASNSRVDDIRELREGVSFTPESCKYKVYIIDEVHMLSPGAFNALLKTMEEPPEHVKFILATTEVHKVPETIVSRCQHFDFSRIKTEDIVARLNYIASCEGFSLDDDAALMIARLSDGGMRDALSLLDRCSAYSENITSAVVSNAAGIAGRDYLFSLLEAIADRDTAGVVAQVDELHGKSKDLKLLCGELLEMMRNLMLIRSTHGAQELVMCTADEYKRLSETAEKMPLERIFGCITLLQQTSDRFARAANKRIELEMCMVRLCSDNASQSKTAAQVPSEQLDELKERLDMLSRAVADGRTPDEALKKAAPKPIPPKTARPKKKFDPSNFAPLDEWEDILEIINKKAPAIWAFLKNSRACIEDDVFYVVVSNDFFLEMFKKSNDKDFLKKIVNEYYGKNFGFMLYSSKNVEISDNEDPINGLLKRAESMNVEVEIKK